MDSNAEYPVPAMLPAQRSATQVAPYSSAAAAPPPDLLDFRGWIAAFRRRLPLFIAALVAGLALTAFFTLRQTPMYEAVATVVITAQQPTVVQSAQVAPGVLQAAGDSSPLETQLELLKSRALADRVARQLKLDEDPDFNPYLNKQEGTLDRVRRLLGAAPQPQPTPPAEEVHESVLDALQGSVSFRRAGMTAVIEIVAYSANPTKAAAVANAYAQAYLDEQLLAKSQATREANEWLSNRIVELRRQVEAADAAVAQYKINNNLLSAAGTTLTEQQISMLNQQEATARAGLAEDQARLRIAREQLQGGSTGEDVGEALGSSVVQQLRNKRAEISGRVADLQGRYGPRHPDLLKAQRELADNDALITAEIKRIISNLEARVGISRDRLRSLQGSLGAVEGSLASNNRTSVRLQELQRDADAARIVYESYLNRYKDTSAQVGLERADARIVSQARLPDRPSSPNVPMNFAVGLLASCAAGLALIVLASMLDTTLSTADDVERRLGMRYLTGIPLLRSLVPKARQAPEEYVARSPLSFFAETFRSLKTALVYNSNDVQAQIVAITSALPGEGKTTAAACLARTIALQGHKVVIVDCDLRRASLSRLFKRNTSVGLIEVLNGSSTLQDAILKDEASGADLLPLVAAGGIGKDIFSSPAMDDLLHQLRANYEVIILDTAPVLAVAETRVLAVKADTVLFLAQWRKTPAKAIENALQLLEDTGAHISGLALTQIDVRKQMSTGYGDPIYYYSSYAKYYSQA